MSALRMLANSARHLGRVRATPALGAVHTWSLQVARESGKAERRPVQWQHPDYYNEEKLEEEMRRVLDVCHGCRACFDLCDSFPTLFKMVDATETGELSSVPSDAFKDVVDQCTLCDMCFSVTCPYVPPHELEIDFPHLMLRYRAVERAKTDGLPDDAAAAQEPFRWPHAHESAHVDEGVSRQLQFAPADVVEQALADTDRLAALASPAAPLTNWVVKRSTGSDSPRPIRKAVEAVTGLSSKADLPSYVTPSKQLVKRNADAVELNEAAPAFQARKKVLIYATCLGNYNKPDIGIATRAVLAHNGVHSEFYYEQCCGMPQLEQGNIPAVKESATKISSKLIKYVEDGYTVVPLVASCALMMKAEWPLLFPNDPNVTRLAENVKDISEYVMSIHKDHGLVDGMQELDGNVALHNACHARAQNVGSKSREMMQLLPNVQMAVIDKCSGHGGSWGARKEHFATAMKVGKGAGRQVLRHAKKAEKANKQRTFIASDCPLAGSHLEQMLEDLGRGAAIVTEDRHPIELLAKSYGLQ